MGEIGERHHVSHENGGNDEINISGLTGATEIVDTPADGETTKGISSNWAYDHNADVTKHRPVFVDRGDPAAQDFTQSTLTIDGTWYDLDLSGIVPVGTIAVLLTVYILCATIYTTFSVRKKGNIYNIARSYVINAVANVPAGGNMIVAVDSNRKIQYMGEVTVPADLRLAVVGWWI